MTENDAARRTEQDLLSPQVSNRLGRQIDAWCEQLMSLDRRQKLLYFRHTKSSTMEVARPSLGEVLRTLERRPTVGLTDARPDENGVVDPEDKALLHAPLGVRDKNAKELRNGLSRLATSSATTYADKGYWTLYAGLGVLDWQEIDDPRRNHSPLVLVPVRLQREGVQAPFTLERTEDDAIVNPALRLKLERDFDIVLPALDPDDVDPQAYCARVDEAIAGQTSWYTSGRAILATFSFHKEAIYRDLSDHRDLVMANDLIQRIALGSEAAESELDEVLSADDIDLDQVAPPERMRTILDADSSQRACIVAARDGKSFVMDGPPGTGKSQTIANIIAELVAQGRSVLFVSEKAAALDVVRNRLSEEHLGDFLLELHSHAATRKQVIAQLDRALSTRVRVDHGLNDADRTSLTTMRTSLTEFADAMNESRLGLERSMIDVLGDLMPLVPLDAVAVTPGPSWAQLDRVSYDQAMTLADRLSRAWRPVALGDDYLWRSLAQHEHGATERRRMSADARNASDAASALERIGAAVDDDLSISLGRSVAAQERRHRLLEHGMEAPDYLDDWLVVDDFEQLQGRFVALEQASETFHAARSEVESFTGVDWTAVDPDPLPAVSALAEPDQSGRHLWRGGTKVSASQLDQFAEFLEMTPVLLADALGVGRQLAAVLGISHEELTPARLGQIVELADIAQGTARPEQAWLNPTVQSALDESFHVLASIATVVRERRAAMRAVFTAEALDLDLAAMNTRFKETHSRFGRRWSSQARADRKALKAATVRKRVDKGVLVMLDEAVAWQAAEVRLSRDEQQYAGRLGGYYRSADTDFSRLQQAVQAAHRAVRLAGRDLDIERLGRQVSVDGETDPRLPAMAADLRTKLDRWLSPARTMVDESLLPTLLESSLQAITSWSQEEHRRVAPAVEGVLRTSSSLERDVSLDDAVRVLRMTSDLSDAQATLYDSYESDQRLLGSGYLAEGTNWASLRDAIAWAQTMRELLGGPATPLTAERLRNPVLEATTVESAVNEWAKTRDEVTAWFGIERSSELRHDLDIDVGEAADLLAEMADVGESDVAEWDRFVQLSTELGEVGLSSPVDAMIRARVPASEVVPRIRWAVLQTWVESVSAADPRLSTADASDRDALVRRYREADRQLVGLAHTDVIAACSALRPRSAHGAGAQLIRREAQKKTRHKPIREVLSVASEIVQKLKPCFMMSPLSVSQFLPGEVRFDVVIFDEASQVIPADAVNCIYRGTQLIVAGDEKQLPPTSFFQAADDESDADEEEPDEFESILKSCKSGVMPQLPLQWHYRSRHEDLIAFSNNRFYVPDQQPLQTFPGAVFDSPDLGVGSFVVPGVYRRGSTRDNPIEAEAVVERVAFHRHAHPDLSIGVVTFSAAQQDAVLAAMERKAADDAGLAELVDDHNRLDGFFVKNIENVQGDERDIIIFSVGYGPDENGKPGTNFGALNRKGGWRRLNVAITRARRRVEVVSSMRAGEIPDSPNENVRHLRAYMDFAARGAAALALDIGAGGGDAESPFEEDVISVVRGWGYEVTPQVGVAGYRIDIGVRHPDRPGEYLLGVECDGAAYHSARTARDRDRLRASVLEGLGWRLHRIWGLSWYRDRRTQVERLRRALDEALSDNGARPAETDLHSSAKPLVEDVDLDAPPDWAVPYVACTDRAFGDPAGLHLPEARPDLRRYLASVMQQEAPIHDSLVMKRIRDAYGVGRVGHRIRENVEHVLSSLTVRSGAGVTKDAQGFYAFDDRTVKQVRVPVDEDTVRAPELVPVEELAKAAAHTVSDSVVIGDEALTGALCGLFGWRRRTNDLNSAVRRAIEYALHRGWIERTPSGELRQTGSL